MMTCKRCSPPPRKNSPPVEGCPQGGEGSLIPLYNKNLRQYVRENRKAGILAEVLLWNQLKQGKLGCKFTKQKPIGNYIADFYCKSANLVIEIDGESHRAKQEYDAARDAYMAGCGIKVLRFCDRDILKNMEGVLGVIQGTLPVGHAPATPPVEGN